MDSNELDPEAFYFWTIRDERTGKPRKTKWRMRPAEAAASHPGAVPDLASKERRDGQGQPASTIGTRK